MNFRLWLCVGMGVFTAHIGVIMLLAQIRPKPKPTPPNFKAVVAEVIVDASTGEKTTVREFTVSTKLAEPAR